MNCSEFEQCLNQQLDGVRSPTALEFDQHLADCLRCRELHQATRLLVVGLRARSCPAPAAHLSDRIVAGVLAERRQQRLRRVVQLALAAAVALIVLPLGQRLAHLFPSPAGSELIAKQAEEKQPEKKTPDVAPRKEHKPLAAPSLTTKVEKAQEVLTAWTGRLAEQTREKAQVFLQVAPAVSMPPMGVPVDGTEEDAPLDPAVHSLQEAGSGVTSGLQTVTGSAQRAVHLFAQVVGSLKTNQ
jgi:hypothetical protein